MTVNFGTEDGGAAAGDDYQATSGTLRFAPGETHKTLTVLVYGDRVFELSEAFSVRLSGASRATIADGVGFVTILDDEPRISIDGAWAVEGNSGTTPFNFTVSLSAAYDQPVTVNYDTGDGTATTGDNDYLAASGTLTFAPGETTKTVVVEVMGDAAAEEFETFYVNLGGASANALIVGDRGDGSIEDDDGYYDYYSGWGSQPAGSLPNTTGSPPASGFDCVSNVNSKSMPSDSCSIPEHVLHALIRLGRPRGADVVCGGEEQVSQQGHRGSRRTPLRSNRS